MTQRVSNIQQRKPRLARQRAGHFEAHFVDDALLAAACGLKRAALPPLPHRRVALSNCFAGAWLWEAAGTPNIRGPELSYSQ